MHLCEVGYNLAINKFQENVMIPFSAALTTALATCTFNTLVSIFWSWQLTQIVVFFVMLVDLCSRTGAIIKASDKTSVWK